MKFRNVMLGLGLLAVFNVPALATPIAADDTWHEFLFSLAVSPVVSCGGVCVPTSNPVAEQTSSPPWTFTGPATLTVLDLFSVGDRFEAFDFGVSLGTTTIVVNTGGNPCGGDIACALADPAYSRLIVTIPDAIAHSLTLNVIQNAANTTGGAAAFQLSPSQVPEVPEPATLVLIGSALTGSLVRRRLRKKRT